MQILLLRMEIIMRVRFLIGWWCVLLFSAFALGAEAASLQELIKASQSGEESARVQALDQLGLEGSKASEAVPELTALLKDTSPAVRAHAVRALGEIGAAARSAVPAIARLIADPDESVRRNTVAALRRIRPGPQVGVPLFIKIMEDPDPTVRMRAVSALAAGGKDAVPFLVEALKNEKAAYWACIALNRIGPEAQAAVPSLTKLLEDKNPQIRREALLALAEIGKPAATAIPQIVKTIANSVDRTTAIYTLGRIGVPAANAEEKIKQYINNPDKFLATISIWTLAKLHPENKQLAREATEQLFAGLKSDDPQLRTLCARGLALLKPGPEIALPVMEKAFQGADEQVMRGALDALAGLGPAAVPKLIEALKYEKIRPYVIYIIGQNGPAAKAAVEELVKYIDDKNPRVQHETMIALAKIGPAAKNAVPEVIKALEKNEGSLACAATYALGSIGADRKEASELISKNLASPDETLALISAWALAQLQPNDAQSAEKAVPVLIRGLGESEVKYRRGAAKALGKFGPLAKSALPALQQALHDEDETVRKASAEALKAIGS
jgi:HEAT repeat protein